MDANSMLMAIAINTGLPEAIKNIENGINDNSR